MPAVRLNPDLPLELERIINKALEKDRNLRYQGAAELRSDLQRLKRDADTGRSAVRAIGGDQERELTVTGSSGKEVASERQPFVLKQSRSLRWQILAPLAILLAALIAAGLRWRLHEVSKLTDKDTIVLGDFENTTGDPVFDGTLRRGLSVQFGAIAVSQPGV
jgi:hypothetical protein